MPAGRPKKEIDYTTVEKLANIQCTQDEIASFLGISTRTLQRDEQFMELFNRGRENGKMSLRRIQWKHAEKSVPMAIWLGKQYLGQVDKVETTGEIKTTPTIKLEVVDNSNLESVLYDNKEH